MRAAIIVFSPSGHTLQVANMFKNGLEDKGVGTQLIDMTKRPEYLDKDRIRGQLEKELGEHDVLLVGGPIYAGHIEGHVLRLIERLPEVGGWYGDIAVPFVTYGGVHSSIALEEMGRALRDSNRRSLLGVKITAEHTLMRTAANTINKGRPGKEEEGIILQAVEMIVGAASENPENIMDASKSFSYTRLIERMVLRRLSQEFFHKKHKRVSIDAQKCIRCEKCVAVCPVNMFGLVDGDVRMVRDSDRCILCAECYHNCPADAIVHSYIAVAKRILKDGSAKLEKEQSAIYQ